MNRRIVDIRIAGALGSDEAARSFFSLFAHLPRQRPLEREMGRLHPTQLNVPAQDLGECSRAFEEIWSDLELEIEVYLQSLEAAKAEPLAPHIALACLANRGFLGLAGYRRWFRLPIESLSGMSPEKWLKAKTLTRLAELLSLKDCGERLRW